MTKHTSAYIQNLEPSKYSMLNIITFTTHQKKQDVHLRLFQQKTNTPIS